jgi:shikimate kinase
MPGTGKSKIGRLLAATLDLPFFDLDDLIVAHEGEPITEIFEHKGEVGFRLIEQELLKATSQENERFVMATGGGAPCFHHNMDFMKAHGTTVFLDIPVTAIHDHLVKKGTEKRPLLKGRTSEQLLAELSKKYEQRKEHYERAHIIIGQDYGDPDERVKKVLNGLSA